MNKLLFKLMFVFFILFGVCFIQTTTVVAGFDELIYNEDGNVIVDDEITIDMMDDIEDESVKVYVREGAKLNIDANADVAGEIVLENAESLILDSNTNINKISGQVGKIDIQSNANIKYMDIVSDSLKIGSNADIGFLSGLVKGTTNFTANFDVKTALLRTNKLRLSANSDILDGVIYVYEDFEGRANGDFKGKLTVFDSYNVDANTDFNGELCVLGAITLGANTDIKTYGFAGLFGNLNPILKVDIGGNKLSVKLLAQDFDKNFGSTMQSIKKYNGKIYSLSSKIKKEKDEDKKETLMSQKNDAVSQKSVLKSNFKKKINEVFKKVKDNIDDMDKSQKLFGKIKQMYIDAIDFEDAGMVFNVCNNSDINGDANSTYVKNGQIYFDGLKVKMKRNKVLNEAYNKLVVKKVSKLSDKKVKKVLNKINDATAIYAKKDKEMIVNVLMDVKDIMKEFMIYDNE